MTYCKSECLNAGLPVPIRESPYTVIRLGDGRSPLLFAVAVGMVGAELGDHRVAGTLGWGDRLAQPAGGPVRRGENVERGQGSGMIGAQGALEPLGGRFRHP